MTDMTLDDMVKRNSSLDYISNTHEQANILTIKRGRDLERRSIPIYDGQKTMTLKEIVMDFGPDPDTHLQQILDVFIENPGHPELVSAKVREVLDEILDTVEEVV